MKKPRMNWQRFAAILHKEIIQVKRDPISMMIPIVMPVVMMLLFGYALNTEVEHIQTAVYDCSQTQESRAYIQAFAASNFFDINYYAGSQQELTSLVENGTVRAGLWIPESFARDLKSNHPLECELIIDGSDPTTARTALTSGVLINQMFQMNLKEGALKDAGVSQSALPSVTLATQVLYNPNLEGRRFTIPGLVAVIMQNITVILTSLAMVREKERGTIEQLIVTPVRPLELILGKLVPYVLIGYAGFLFTLGLCVFWFGIVPAGSIWLLLSIGLLFTMSSLMIGMLISTLAKNQSQALMANIAVLLPSILLSGFMFPREAMPPVVGQIGLLFPITYFLDIIRGVILKGVGVSVLATDILALLGIFVVLLVVTILRFKKSLD